MKKLLLLTLVIVTVSSCTMEKRLYNRGWNVQWKKHDRVANNKPVEIEKEASRAQVVNSPKVKVEKEEITSKGEEPSEIATGDVSQPDHSDGPIEFQEDNYIVSESTNEKSSVEHATKSSNADEILADEKREGGSLVWAIVLIVAAGLSPWAWLFVLFGRDCNSALGLGIACCARNDRCVRTGNCCTRFWYNYVSARCSKLDLHQGLFQQTQIHLNGVFQSKIQGIRDQSMTN